MTGRLDRASAAVANAMRILPAAGEPGHMSAGESAAGQRRERLIERVHSLGPRPLSEMLAEIAIATGQPGVVMDRLHAYAALDSAIVRALGGDRFPPMPLGLVR